MVDEVEIKNVGGFTGVASEATLLKLIAAVERKGGAGSGSNVQEVYTKSVKAAATGNNIFVKGIKGAAATVGRFANELLFGGTRVSDFSSAIFGANSSVTKLTQFIDRNVDTWRELSSVGASFNNSIFDMIAASANSGMSLDQFSELVRRNSVALASFGGTTTRGAKQFGDFSKNFRRGIGQQFFEMGFTIADVNEGLMGFFEIQRRSTSQTLRFDKTQQSSAANYILQLDKLSKITGLQRSVLEDAMKSQVQDAGVRSQLNRLSGTAQDNLRNTLAFLDTELQGPLADGLKDLMDGVAQTDIGKALASQLPGIGAFAEKMFAGGASMDEVITQLSENFGPQLEGMSNQFSKAQLDQMRAQGGMSAAIAEMMDSAYQLNRLKGRNTAAAVKEQQQRDLLTSTFGVFEQSIVDLRAYLVDTFFEIGGQSGGILDAFKNLGNKIMELISPSGGAVTGFGTTIETITTSLFGPEGVFTNAINIISTQLTEFSELVKEGGFLKAFETKLTELGNWISNWFKEIFFGKDIQDKDRQGTTHQKGLFAQVMDGMVSGFESFWEGPYGKYISETVTGFFKDLVDNIIVEVANATGGLFFFDARQKILGDQQQGENDVNNGGIVTTNVGDEANYDASMIAKKLSEIEGLQGGFWASATPADLGEVLGKSVQDAYGKILGASSYDIGETLNRLEMKSRGTGGENDLTPEELAFLNAAKAAAKEKGIDGFANGTSGFQNFGSQSISALHGIEAVVPRNTAAGDILSTVFGDDWNNPKIKKDNAKDTSAYNNTNNQTMSNERLDQLNTTMLRVASLLEAGLGVQTRTMKGVRAQSGDLFRSLGR